MNTDQLNHNYRPSTSFDDREDYQSSKAQQLEDNYSDALVKYKQAMTELEKALGVQKDFEKLAGPLKSLLRICDSIKCNTH